MTSSATAPLLPLWAAVPVAAAAGAVLDAGFPDRNLWPLAFVGVGLILFTLIGRRIGGALLVGFVAGLSFYLIHVAWTALYLGPVPWVALSTLEALFFALGAAAITLAYRWAPRVWPGVLGRIGLVPVLIGALWTLREAIASTWPYGGFAWGRIAQSQSISPLAPLVAWLGISALGFVIVTVVALIVQCAREWWVPSSPWTHTAVRSSVPQIAAGPIPPALRVIVPAVVIAAILAVPAWQPQITGSATIAAVQGNGKAGYFDEREPGDILRTQIDATNDMLEEHADEDIDAVVWPEGASDLNPIDVPQAGFALDRLSMRADAPLVVGTVTQSGDEVFNSSLLWDVDDGMLDQYDKRRPIPFGEYVPDRSFWEPFAPDLIGLIQREYVPGRTDPVFDLGAFVAGISICFDIVDDALIRETVRDGAEIVFAQTNNADFGQTDENQQQLAIARMRAIESGRALVNISTVGRSQMIGPDGRTIESIPAYEAGSMVTEMPLATGITPAIALGAQLEALIALFGLFALAVAGYFGNARRAFVTGARTGHTNAARANTRGV